MTDKTNKQENAATQSERKAPVICERIGNTKFNIHIHFSESPGRVCCEITNSYHPKSQTDKSGSGIGLEQVRKRLELTYPGQYEWTQGVSDDGKEYKSILSLFNIQHYESNLCHSR